MDSKIQNRPLSQILKSYIGQQWRARRRRENLELFFDLRRQRVDYLRNPASNELHALRLGNIGGSHNLLDSNLAEFDVLWDLGERRISTMKNGSIITVVDRLTGKLLQEFKLNKCAHCFPAARTPFQKLADFSLN